MQASDQAHFLNRSLGVGHHREVSKISREVNAYRPGFIHVLCMYIVGLLHDGQEFCCQYDASICSGSTYTSRSMHLASEI